MTPLSQRDPRWASMQFGSSTVGQVGCTITGIAILLGTTPDVVLERMRNVGGFKDGNLVIWAKIPEAFPGITVRREWSYNNDDVKQNVPVLVQVDGTPIGAPTHFVVYIGNQQMIDPWTGQVEPTSKYRPVSYAVIKGSWQQIDKPYLEQLTSQIEATTQCQSQLKTALEQNTHLQEKMDSYISQLNEYKIQLDELRKKYEDEQQRVIHLKDEITKIHEEDKNFAQEALDAQHLATERQKLLHTIAKTMNLQYDPTNDKKLVEDILEKIEIQQREAKASEVPEIGQLQAVLKQLIQMGINPYLASQGIEPIDPNKPDPQIIEKVSVYLTAVTNQVLGLTASLPSQETTPVINKRRSLLDLLKPIISLFFDNK